MPRATWWEGSPPTSPSNSSMVALPSLRPEDRGGAQRGHQYHRFPLPQQDPLRRVPPQASPNQPAPNLRALPRALPHFLAHRPRHDASQDCSRRCCPGPPQSLRWRASSLWHPETSSRARCDALRQTEPLPQVLPVGRPLAAGRLGQAADRRRPGGQTTWASCGMAQEEDFEEQRPSQGSQPVIDRQSEKRARRLRILIQAIFKSYFFLHFYWYYFIINPSIEHILSRCLASLCI